MFDKLTSGLDFHSKALVLRAERQRILASNMANADTPGYVARDFNFRETLTQMTRSSASELTPSASQPSLRVHATQSHPRHFPVATQSGESTLSNAGALKYGTQSQPSVDGNSVDMDRERANFVDNSVRYESTLRFINGQSKTILSAIQGQ